MKHFVTNLLLVMLLAAIALPAWAQPERVGVDVVWARDIEGATMTLDGMLDEPEWMSAETIPFVWNQPNVLPGSGQKTELQPVLAEPSDGINATAYFLRDGNMLWLGVMAADSSVGGRTSLWGFDGLIMTILDRSQRPDTFGTREEFNYPANGVVNAEFIPSWWNPADTTDESSTFADGSPVGSGQTIPGGELRLFGDYGVAFGEGRVERDPEDVAVWDAVGVVDGITNDDTHGPDNGYTIEMYIDLGAMGYDFDGEGGDKTPFSIAVEDEDFQWPLDSLKFYRSRVWFQSQWANNFNEGVAWIYGSPDVTVSSGDAPSVTEPEFSVYRAGSLGAPVIDGSLDDAVWQMADTLFYMQYEMEPAEAARNVGTLVEYHLSWWEPDIGNGRSALHIDRSEARIQMTHEDGILYVGIDVDDQAVSGVDGEAGRDGLRMTMRNMTLDSDLTLASYQFDFYVDSTGSLAFALDAGGIRDTLPDAITGAVHLKGSTTVADPSDVDEGYQIEVAIDLGQALGYESAGKGQYVDNRFWIAMNFFDGDFLESLSDSYATRTWFLGERAQGASLYGYLNEQYGVAVEESVEIPNDIQLYGSYPNPFNPSTLMTYAIPTAGDVSIEVFSILGQKVAVLEPGVQSAGRHEVMFDAGGLTSGVYFYRVALSTDASVTMSRADRLVLVK